MLRLFNLLQFLPSAWWTTSRGIEEHLYHQLPDSSRGWMTDASVPAAGPGLPSSADPEGPETTAAWADALRFTAKELHLELKQLQQLGVHPPEPGFELTGAQGRVLAEAELGLEDHRVAVLMTGRSRERSIFEEHGWRVLRATAPDLVGSVSTLLTGDSA